MWAPEIGDSTGTKQVGWLLVRGLGSKPGDEERHFSAQRATVHQEDLIVLDTYTPHNGVSVYMTHKYIQSFQRPHLHNGWDDTKISKDRGDLGSTAKQDDVRVFMGRCPRQRSVWSFKCTWNAYRDRPHSPPWASHWVEKGYCYTKYVLWP